MDLLYWIGGFFGVVALAVLLFRWTFAKDDPRNYEMTGPPQPWSDPNRFGEDD